MFWLKQNFILLGICGHYVRSQYCWIIFFSALHLLVFMITLYNNCSYNLSRKVVVDFIVLYLALLRA